MRLRPRPRPVTGDRHLERLVITENLQTQTKTETQTKTQTETKTQTGT